MKKAVIYARYSSDKQTEQSIEGQLYDCYNYAKSHDISIVGEYIDRAMTGRNDDRPQFQKMIKDSSLGEWEYVLVWKFDRFSRNTYDSAVNKRILQKNGVRVISAMENISDDTSGQLMEHMLESFAEYYSADLREKTIRGMHQTALKCESTGHIPLGYTVKGKKYIINENERYIPETVFRRYAKGDRLTDIADDLNKAGYRTRKGHKFKCSSFYSMLSNEKYTGKYIYDDVAIPGGMPAMIDEQTFEAVRKRLAINKKRAAKNAAKADYILSGKLFCGECGEPMSGYCGKGRNGVVHYYYRCNGVHNKTGCKKHHEKKEPLEIEVCNAAKAAFSEMDSRAIAEQLHKMYVDQVTADSVPIVESQINEIRKQIDNLVTAIMNSGSNPILINKLNELTERKEQLETELTVTQRMAENVPSVEQIITLIDDIMTVDIDTPTGRKTLIDVMISKVYVFDDRITIVFNNKDKSKTDIPYEQIKDSISSAEVSQSKNILSAYVVDSMFIYTHKRI